MKNYAKIENLPLSGLFIQAKINSKNQLMMFYDSLWQEFPRTGRSTGEYIVFYQGVPIDYCTYVSGPVFQYTAESEYNALCTAVRVIESFRILDYNLLKKGQNVVPEQAPFIVLDTKSAICMAKTAKDTKHTIHVSRIIHFVRNGEE